MMTRERGGGGAIPPKNDDVIYEQPLTNNYMTCQIKYELKNVFSDLSWTEDIKLKSPNGYKGEFTYNQEYNLLGCTQPKVNQSTRMTKRPSEMEYQSRVNWWHCFHCFHSGIFAYIYVAIWL